MTSANRGRRSTLLGLAVAIIQLGVVLGGSLAA